MRKIARSQLCWWSLASPVGELLLVADDVGLRGLHFQDGPQPIRPSAAWKKDRQPFNQVIQQLEKYFAGKLQSFQIKLSLQGTAFQISVWDALRQIPYGATANYGHIACQLGNPKASRAVGAANGKNPISIIVPCHRIIGKNGNLVGYGGGLSIKEALLNLERRETGIRR